MYNNSDENVNGFIIDIAWLGEEFVGIKLLDKNKYIHYIAGDKKYGSLKYTNSKHSNGRPWDYKPSDMYQLLSYLYLTGDTKCGAIFPVLEDE